MAASAYSKAAKRQAKRGRPKKEGVLRTASGQISRSTDSRLNNVALEQRLALETATWRRRMENPSLSIEQARLQENGLVIAAWLAAYEKSRKRKPDVPHLNMFTQTHYDTAMSYLELHRAYEIVTETTGPRSSSDLNRTPGRDGRDPFDAGRARRHEAVETLYRECRTAILESGSLGMMAIQAVLIENKDIVSMLPDLRCALNAIFPKLKVQRAA